jgi:hypothetical protein
MRVLKACVLRDETPNSSVIGPIAQKSQNLKALLQKKNNQMIEAQRLANRTGR